MKKIFLLIPILFLCFFVMVNAFEGHSYTWFHLRTDCSLVGCDAWIEVSGDPIPSNFFLYGDGTNGVSIETYMRKWNRIFQDEVLWRHRRFHITTKNFYSGSVGIVPGEQPKLEKVIYNGMNIELGECHYVNEPDWDLQNIHAICHDNDESAYIQWSTADEPYWFYLVKNYIQTITEQITNIWNTLTDHETRISVLENVTTIITTSTTISTTTTTPICLCGFIEENYNVCCPSDCQPGYYCRADVYRNDVFRWSEDLDPRECKRVNSGAGYSIKLYGIC